MEYQIKALKQMEMRNGIAYTANLYRGNKRVASVENDGNGGMTWVRFDDRAGEDPFVDWMTANLDRSFRLAAYLDDDAPAGQIMEIGVEWLITVYENNKASGKKILWKETPDPASDPMDPSTWQPASPEYTTGCPDPARREARIAQIAARFPQAIVWDVDTARWVPAVR